MKDNNYCNVYIAAYVLREGIHLAPRQSAVSIELYLSPIGIAIIIYFLSYSVIVYYSVIFQAAKECVANGKRYNPGDFYQDGCEIWYSACSCVRQ